MIEVKLLLIMLVTIVSVLSLILVLINSFLLYKISKKKININLVNEYADESNRVGDYYE